MEKNSQIKKILILFACFGLGILTLGGWYKLYAKNQAMVYEPEIVTYEPQINEVRAFKSEIYELLDGDYTIELDYQCDSNQKYEILYVTSDGYECLESGNISAGKEHDNISFSVPKGLRSCRFLLGVSYNGEGTLSISKMTLYKEKELIGICFGDGFSSDVVGAESGKIEGIPSLYATYLFKEIPSMKNPLIVSSDFDTENYFYEISSLDYMGAKSVTYQSWNAETVPNINFPTGGRTYLRVDLYRMRDDGNNIHIQIQNENFIQECKYAAKRSMIILLFLLIMFLLLTAFDYRQHKHYAQDARIWCGYILYQL